MASEQSDTLKRANLTPLAGAISHAWQYFGFKMKEGKVVEPSQVSFRIYLYCAMECGSCVCPVNTTTKPSMLSR